MTQTQTNAIDTALNLANAGFPVIACKADKSPLATGTQQHGYHDATTDNEALVKLFSDPTATMVGLRLTEKLLVIDLDVDKPSGDKIGEDNFNRWWNSAKALAAAVVIDTPSGGKHLLFKPHPKLTKRWAGKWMPKVDILGDGYVCFYGDSADTLNELQDFPDHLANELLHMLDNTPEHKTPKIDPLLALLGEDVEYDDSDTRWKITEVLENNPNSVDIRQDVIDALMGLRCWAGDNWEDWTELVYRWLDRYPGGNSEKHKRNMWNSLKPDGSVGIGTFFKVTCVDQGLPVPSRAVPKATATGTGTLDSDWYFLQDSHRVFNIRQGRQIEARTYDMMHGIESTAKLSRDPDRSVANVAYRPDKFTGNADPVFGLEHNVKYIQSYRPPGFIANPAHLETPEWQAVEQHFHNLLADDTVAGHVLDWCAYLVQKPGHKIAWSPVVIGPQGNGKTTLRLLLAAAMGEWNVYNLNRDALKADYNDWAVSYCLVALEEVKISHGRYEQMDRLKELITADFIGVRKMRTDAYRGKNIANYIMFSNHLDALAVSTADRRYMICDSKHQTKEEAMNDGMNPAYFTKLYSVINQHPEIIFSGLALRDISGFNPNGHAPHTEALERMGEHAMPEDAVMLKEDIEDLTDHHGVNGEVIPLCWLSDNVTDRIKTKALKRAFAHLDYWPWEGSKNGRVDLKSAGPHPIKTRLYVRRQHVKSPWSILKPMVTTETT